jgi:hypothetical protein
MSIGGLRLGDKTWDVFLGGGKLQGGTVVHTPAQVRRCASQRNTRTHVIHTQAHPRAAHTHSLRGSDTSVGTPSMTHVVKHTCSGELVRPASYCWMYLLGGKE